MYIMIRWKIASTFFQFAINLQSICKKVTYIFLKSNPQHTRKVQDPCSLRICLLPSSPFGNNVEARI